jgi:hypothetical protein
MKTVAIIGAGGKMGARAAAKLTAAGRWRLLLCESDPRKAAGLDITPTPEAMQQADHVVMAVPDALIGRIARELVPLMKQGGTLIMLDAAAAYIGELPSREGVTQMIAHPCHPPFFTVQPTPEAQTDYFGGVAKQDIVVALIEGGQAQFEEGIEVCRDMFSPVNRALQVTPEQFALLEPAMAEILVAAACCWMKDVLEETVARGVRGFHGRPRPDRDGHRIRGGEITVLGCGEAGHPMGHGALYQPGVAAGIRPRGSHGGD